MLQSNVSNGTLNLNSDGSFTYTPNKRFTGSDGFTYGASDGNGSDTATVAISVTGKSGGGGGGSGGGGGGNGRGGGKKK